MKLGYRILLSFLFFSVGTFGTRYWVAHAARWQDYMAGPNASSFSQTGHAVQLLPTFAPTPNAQKRLPDAVYFLNSAGQIARLAADGVQVTQITHEAAAVTAFDVAPDGEHLAYISANSLIESRAQGEQRIVKVKGVAVDTTDAKQRTTQALGYVLYTPDSKRITFGLNGINWIASGANVEDAQVLLANDPYPDLQKLETIGKAPHRFVSPIAWSPDGRRLLLVYYYYASDNIGAAVFDLTTNQLTNLACRSYCVWSMTWGRDSQALFATDNTYASVFETTLGITRLDATTGAATVLVQGVPAGLPSATNPTRFFHAVYQTNDGTFLTFSEMSPLAPPLEPITNHYTLQRVTADGAQITPVRTDSYLLHGETLWAADGSGVLINNSTNGNVFKGPGPLIWLPSDGRPAVPLPANGSNLQWRTRPAASSTPVTAVSPTPVHATTAQATTLTLLNVRNGPGTAYAIVDQLAAGATAQVVGRTPDGTECWWQIVYPAGSTQRAWIVGATDLVQVDRAAPIPVAAQLPPLPAPTSTENHPACN